MTDSPVCETCRGLLFAGPDGAHCLNPRCAASIAVTDDALARIVVERRPDGHDYVSVFRTETVSVTTLLPLIWAMLTAASQIAPQLARGMLAHMAARN